MATKAKTIEELIYHTNQALDEVFDLKASIEYDEEYMEAALAITGVLEQQLNDTLSIIKQTDYCAGGHSDLPFMEIVMKGDERLIPFKHLLCVINSTHTEGYAEPDQ
ncbi:MAG: hypothetical protein KAQ67_03305 [Gammaproteobacteria bacterium]|nr:hypothetical protein [Gammaproteobacteria bacterium]